MIFCAYWWSQDYEIVEAKDARPLKALDSKLKYDFSTFHQWKHVKSLASIQKVRKVRILLDKKSSDVTLKREETVKMDTLVSSVTSFYFE